MSTGLPAIYHFTSTRLPATVCLERHDGNRMYMSVFPGEWEQEKKESVLIQQKQRACIENATALMMDELQAGLSNSSSAGTVYIPRSVYTAGTARWMQYLMEFCHLNKF